MGQQVKMKAGAGSLAKVIEMVQVQQEVREATTGRAITLPKVWAVAASPAGTAVEMPGRVPNASYTASRDAQEATWGELGFYRKYTEALLRRYLQMTMEAGRVPSIMGREVIGGRASSYRIHGFDDAVIFRLDVERCLAALEPEDREVIRRVAIQEHTQSEAAALMGVSLRTVVTRYSRAMDRLTEILLRGRLLEPLKGCQGAELSRRSVN